MLRGTSRRFYEDQRPRDLVRAHGRARPVRRRPLHAPQPQAGFPLEPHRDRRGQGAGSLGRIDAGHRAHCAGGAPEGRRQQRRPRAVHAVRPFGRHRRHAAIVIQPRPPGRARRRWTPLVRDRQRHDGHRSAGARRRGSAIAGPGRAGRRERHDDAPGARPAPAAPQLTPAVRLHRREPDVAPAHALPLPARRVRCRLD